MIALPPVSFQDYKNSWKPTHLRRGYTVTLFGSGAGKGGWWPRLVVTSSRRGDRQDVIKKTNLPKSPLSKATTSLAYFMWFGGAGTPAHSGFKK